MQWNIFVISATLEAEVGGLKVQGQPGQFMEMLSQNTKSWVGVGGVAQWRAMGSVPGKTGGSSDC